MRVKALHAGKNAGFLFIHPDAALQKVAEVQLLNALAQQNRAHAPEHRLVRLAVKPHVRHSGTAVYAVDIGSIRNMRDVLRAQI